MDIERIIKRSLIIVLVSLLIIMVAKVMLGKAFNNLSKAAEKKQQSAAVKQSTPGQASMVSDASTGGDIPNTASMPDSAEAVTESPAAP